MNNLILLNHLELEKFLNKRNGESKFGEHIQLLKSVSNIYDDIKNLDVRFVIFGIQEDIGVFANHGKTGACNAYQAAIKVLLNTQSNRFTHAKEVLVLGHLSFKDELKQLSALNQSTNEGIQQARALVKTIDECVSLLVSNIVSAGKIPIVIGGGHNNAYGNIKGTSLALKQPINAINFDAHTDFRALEGRHSGNGFSYASAEGFLKNYFVFGLHENYTSEAILETFHSKKELDYNTFEALSVRKELKFKKELKRAAKHITKQPFGLEIDCDAIENIPSSAKTPSGFSVEKTRQFIHFFGSQKQVKYLHICEAAPKKKQASQVGKLVTYLVTDFIRANKN